MTTERLGGRVALVTGSTSGIGLGIARALAASGAAVMLHGLGDPAAMEDLRRGMETDHGVVVGFDGADLFDAEGSESLIAAAHERFGRVDILVNNAGIQHTAPVEDFPDAAWDRIVALNLSAPFRLIRAVVPGMKATGWGRIVNIASAHGLVGSPEKSAYVAAKHGLVGSHAERRARARGARHHGQRDSARAGSARRWSTRRSPGWPRATGARRPMWCPISSPRNSRCRASPRPTRSAPSSSISARRRRAR